MSPSMLLPHPTRMLPPQMSQGKAEGVDAICKEVEAFGTEEDKECLHYILKQAAGSSDKTFQMGRKRDCCPAGLLLPSRSLPDGKGGSRPMKFDDFVQHEHSRRSKLQAAHVLALRLCEPSAQPLTTLLTRLTLRRATSLKLT